MSFLLSHRHCVCPVSCLFCCHTGTVLVLYHVFSVVTQVLFLSCIIPFLLLHRYCACPVSFLFCCCTGTVFVLYYNFCCFPGTVFVLYHTFSVIAQVLFLSFIIPFLLLHRYCFCPLSYLLLLHRYCSCPSFHSFSAAAQAPFFTCFHTFSCLPCLCVGQVRSLRCKVEEIRGAQQAASTKGRVLDFLLDQKKTGKIPGIHGRLVSKVGWIPNTCRCLIWRELLLLIAFM